MAQQQYTIAAIETEYCGYRFRSRLEARWAVFLDALGIEVGIREGRIQARQWDRVSTRLLATVRCKPGSR